MSELEQPGRRLWLFLLLTGIPSLALWILALLARDTSLASALTVTASFVTALLATTFASLVHEFARRPGAGPVVESMEKVRKILADETETAASAKAPADPSQR